MSEEASIDGDPKPTMTKARVDVFVFDTMADWESAYAMAGINNPEFQLEPGRYRVLTVGISKDVVTSMGGLRIRPDLALDELSPNTSAMLILPGGFAWENGGNSQAIEKAREFIDAGVPVAAICAATLALARAGLLDDRLHTSNAPEYIAYSNYHGQEHYRAVAAITDRGVITASGIAPVDFAYEIFKMLGLYKGEVLEAWFALNKTGDPAKFFELMRVANPS